MPPTRGSSQPPPRPASPCLPSRVVAHFDFDAFYVGCERELNPAALLGVPVAVSQYNPYGELRETAADETERRLIVRPGKPVDGDTNGSLIAVSYEARAASVKRNDRGRDAVAKCPELRIVQVPVRHGKADLSMYRDASYRVLKELVTSIKNNCLTKAGASGIKVEKASIDEIYIDLTTAAGEMAQRVIEERDCLNGEESIPFEQRSNEEGVVGEDVSRRGSYWLHILRSFGASTCTTIGGVEEVDANALAANALSKDDLRRGSAAQVADSSADALDRGSRAWWLRSLARWTDTEIGLACGAALAARARLDVASHFAAGAGAGAGGETFTLSGGVSTNKTLSKLASGMKKPNRQTLINPDDDSLQKLFHPLPIGRIQGLGGKFGAEVSGKLGVATVGDLAKLPLACIERHFPPSPNDETAKYLFDISRGICAEEVEDRTLAKSIGCGKTFRNQLALDPFDDREVRKWAGELCGELTERLEVDRRENLRTPKLFGVSVRLSNNKNHTSKSVSAPRAYDKYADTATALVRQVVGSSESKIEGITVFASSFVEVADESSNIMAAFGRASKPRNLNRPEACKRMRQKKKPMGSLVTMWTQSNPNDEVNASTVAKQSTGIDAGGGSSKTNQNDAIDPYVFSQLPSHIQAEILQSQASCGTQPNCREKKNGINSWLLKANSAKSKVATHRDECGGKSNARSFALPQADDIDQDTLAELPPDIQATVLNDIAASARSPRRGVNIRKGDKRKRIENFFAPFNGKA